MTLPEFKEKKFKDIIRTMVEYMNRELDEDEDEDVDCGYTQSDIDECCKILDNYIDDLISLNGNADRIMNCVEKVVLALNVLSESVPSLIETEQRELIAEFIHDAAVEAGLPEPDKHEDITEEWREW